MTALADTTVAITGIGTQVGAIATHVDSVTYAAPVIVDVPGVGEVFELHGVVSGVGGLAVSRTAVVMTLLALLLQQLTRLPCPARFARRSTTC